MSLSYGLSRATQRLARELLRTEEPALERSRKPAAALAFGIQRDAILSHAPLVGLCCSGRAGKSRAAALKWLEVSDRKPGELSAYIALTLKSAKRILWRQLKRLDRELKLGLTFNVSELTISRPDGSTLILLGANRDDLIDVLRGSPFAFVFLDEVAFFREGLVENAIEDALIIRMLDLEGELWIASTPGYVESGYHYEVVTGKKPGWSVFSWTYFDNPHLPEYPVEPDEEKRRALRLKAAIQVRERMGWTEQSPSYVREWLGQYATDLDSLVYAFDRKIHFVEQMPASWHSNRERWTIVIGIDFGSTNATAWVVWAFEKGSAHCYCIRAFKHYGMAPSLCADETKLLIEEFKPAVIVGDSAAKGYIDEHRIRHQIAIVGADKLNKRAHQMTMNDAFRAQPEPRIHLLRGQTEAYASELERIGKNPKFDRHHPRYGEEDPRAENDLCLVAGTMIETVDGPIPIERMRTGDLVWTRAGLRRVTNAWCTGERRVYELQTAHGRLIGTGNHPVWTQRGWVRIADLTVHDMLTTWESMANHSCVTDLVGPDVVPTAVRGVTDGGIAKVYNLTVEREHEYFANGILVSNCDSGLYGWTRCWAWIEELEAEEERKRQAAMQPEFPAAGTAFVEMYRRPKLSQAEESLRGAFGVGSLRKR